MRQSAQLAGISPLDARRRLCRRWSGWTGSSCAPSCSTRRPTSDGWRWRRPRIAAGARHAEYARSVMGAAGSGYGTCRWPTGQWCWCGPSGCGAARSRPARWAPGRRSPMPSALGRCSPSGPEPRSPAGSGPANSRWLRRLDLRVVPCWAAQPDESLPRLARPPRSPTSCAYLSRSRSATSESFGGLTVELRSQRRPPSRPPMHRDQARSPTLSRADLDIRPVVVAHMHLGPPRPFPHDGSHSSHYPQAA
jgi:hypothetical protein